MLMVLNPANLVNICNAQMMLLKVAHSWAVQKDVKVDEKIHTLGTQKRSQIFKHLIGLLSQVPTNFQNVRAYVLISLGQLMLRIIGPVQNWSLVVHHLRVFRSWMDQTTDLSLLLQTHGPKENIILNAIIFAGIYTPFMPPKKVLLQDWTMQSPIVCYDAAFEPSHMFPYLVAASITHTYICNMEIYKK